MLMNEETPAAEKRPRESGVTERIIAHLEEHPEDVPLPNSELAEKLCIKSVSSVYGARAKMREQAAVAVGTVVPEAPEPSEAPVETRVNRVERQLDAVKSNHRPPAARPAVSVLAKLASPFRWTWQKAIAPVLLMFSNIFRAWHAKKVECQRVMGKAYHALSTSRVLTFTALSGVTFAYVNGFTGVLFALSFLYIGFRPIWDGMMYVVAVIAGVEIGYRRIEVATVATVSRAGRDLHNKLEAAVPAKASS